MWLLNRPCLTAGLILSVTTVGAQVEQDTFAVVVRPPDTLATTKGQNTFPFPELGLFSAFDQEGGGGLVGPVRFSPLGLEWYVKEDLSSHSGWYGGAGWRHIGFIRDVPDTTITYKYRTWNFSISAGLAVGNMDRGYFFAGMSMELPFNYRERRFENGGKVDANSAWFSDRTLTTSEALVFGYRTPFQLSVKCMYYLNPFFRPRSLADDPGVHVTDPGGFNPQVISISLQWGLFVADDSPRMVMYGPN